MQHLDEGTIHSWIDGEVDAATGREIEAHLATCPACSTAVAEARGLVAASSRILTALDDVPGGVVPKRAVPPAVKPAKRLWRASSWVTGIAAALVLAIGVDQLGRNEPAALLEDEIANRRTEQAREALQSVAVDSAVVAPPAERARLTANEVSPLRTQPAVASRRDMAATKAPTIAPAPAPAAPSSPLNAPQVAAVAEPAVEQRKDAPATRSLAQDASAAAAPESRAKVAAEELETTRFAGCYRLETSSTRSTMERVSAAAGAAAKTAAAVRGRAVTPSTAPSAAADYAGPPAPAIVRLDTLRQPLGYVARDAFTAAPVGTWRGVGADSARVDMLAAGLFKVALKNRTPCPER